MIRAVIEGGPGGARRGRRSGPRTAEALLLQALAVPWLLGALLAFVIAALPGDRRAAFLGLGALALLVGVVLALHPPRTLLAGHLLAALGSLVAGVATAVDGASTSTLFVVAAWGAPFAFATGSRRTVLAQAAFMALVATVTLGLTDAAPSHTGTEGDVIRWLAWVLSVPAIGFQMWLLVRALRRENASRTEAARLARAARFRWRRGEDVISWPDVEPGADWPMPRSLAEALTLTHPDDREVLRRGAGEADGPFSIEVRRGDEGGPVRTLLIRGDVVRDRDGHVRDVVGTTQDLTGLRRAQAAAREADARFRTVLEAAPDAMLAIDGHGVVRLANAAAERLLGLPRDELVGGPVDRLAPDPAPGDDVRTWEALRSGALVPGRARRLTLRTALGDEVCADLTVGALELDGTGVLLLALRDVTDALRAERSAAELERRLAEAERLESVGRLAGGVAHDFNNLLTVVVAGAEQAGAALGDGHPAAADLAEIRQAAASAADLTHQLLVFSRNDAPRREVVDLAALTRRTSALLARTLGDGRVLEVDAGAVGCTVLADPSELEQVVVNLALNARDAMAGGGVLRLEVGPAPGTGTDGRAVERVLLRVSDTGSGMPPEVLAQAFEPFFTTKRPQRGTGLGLATVQSVVGRLGGTIELRSTPGEGTVVEVLLPRATTAPRPARAAVAGGAGGGGPAGAGERVLVVEDQAAVRRSLVRILSTAGYEVLEAADGEQALALARTRGPIDLVVSDVVMPGMSGPDAVAALRGEHGDLPAVFTSGSATEGTTLQKPFTADSVLLAVRRALGG